MKTILLVFGTRPEAIKMAPLVLALRADRARFRCVTCVTAQHRTMLDQVLRLFDIHPDFDLDVMRPSQDLYDVTSDVLLGMKPVLASARPDAVLVQGDTTTSVAAALAAFYARIPVGHVEAGLRTGNRYSPFPEEINRQMTTRIATWHFAPTRCNVDNLAGEGVPVNDIAVTGNTVIDALQWVRHRIDRDSNLRTRLTQAVARYGYAPCGRPCILVTGHRRESFGQGFRDICTALKRIAMSAPHMDIVYPVHLNPMVRGPVREILSGIGNVYLTEPMDYEPFVYLMGEAYFELTDSGGVQEEAPGLGKPVLVMRENTERPEAVAAGTAKLVGTRTAQIVDAALELVHNPAVYARMAQAVNPYGDGNATHRIIEFLSDRLEAPVGGLPLAAVKQEMDPQSAKRYAI